VGRFHSFIGGTFPPGGAGTGGVSGVGEIGDERRQVLHDFQMQHYTISGQRVGPRGIIPGTMMFCL
jgi:hypothetical protein